MTHFKVEQLNFDQRLISSHCFTLYVKPYKYAWFESKSFYNKCINLAMCDKDRQNVYLQNLCILCTFNLNGVFSNQNIYTCLSISFELNARGSWEKDCVLVSQ